MSLSLPDKARKLTDAQWLDLLIKSIKSRRVNGMEFPGFPPEQIQTSYVGSANEKTLREAFEFYKFMKESAGKLGHPISRKSKFLDFGCGWGRYLRFFWKDVEAENLFGCDIDASIIDICHETNVPGQIDLISPRGKLPYSDNYFDFIMAYSVFTHLPEDIHVHWVHELARVAKPGCVFCLTLEPRRFIDFIKNIPEDTDVDWYRLLSAHKPHLQEYYQRFDSGNLVFMPSNKGVEDTYGDAVVPLSFIKSKWSPFFDISEYLDDAGKFWQAVLVSQRK